MSRWRDAITSLTIEVETAAQHVESPLNVNVIYQIPGNILRPDFEGVRTGHYSRKDSSLIVQAALPEDAPDDVESHIKSLLVAAIDEAEEWTRRRSVAPDLQALRQLAGQL
ncbi:MAG: hypothetical protein ACRDQT_01130 [Gaiellaceae bacterium]